MSNSFPARSAVKLARGIAACAAGALIATMAGVAAAESTHTHKEPSSTGAGARAASRTIEVVMHDNMRFTPSAIEAKPGETLRIVARNAGQIDHELVIGSDRAIREHAEAMKRGGGHKHGGTGNAITVAPGKSGELVVTFREPAVLQMACLIPGHYEAGMRGTVAVAQPSGSGGGAKPKAPAQPTVPHAHGTATHKH
jgi:uncharacterized cupredoxin-like copper-binding protein